MAAKAQPLFLNNYRNTGIGDFGEDLVRELRQIGIEPEYLETSPEGTGFVLQTLKLAGSKQTLIANLGLTSWGSSQFRNFIGFLSIGLRASIGRRTIVLLHNAIEILSPEDAGYPIWKLTKFGAHLAVAFLHKCRIMVFSEDLRRVLEKSYSIDPVYCGPIPCHDAIVSVARPSSVVTVVSIGYLAPYKGLRILRKLPSILPKDILLKVIGGRHRVLGKKASMSALFTDFEVGLRESGAEVTGYVPNSDVWYHLQTCTAGVLPYSSSSGASASFSTLASAGLPVIATNISEFRRLKELGAGIVLSAPTAEAFALTITRVVHDEALLKDLSAMQRSFAKTYSWRGFGAVVANVLQS